LLNNNEYKSNDVSLHTLTVANLATLTSIILLHKNINIFLPDGHNKSTISSIMYTIKKLNIIIPTTALVQDGFLKTFLMLEDMLLTSKESSNTQDTQQYASGTTHPPYDDIYF
jgi:hypothetical protein